MNVKLPIVQNGTKRYVDAELDTSLYAEMKWEAEFPALAAKESIMQYADRMSRLFRETELDPALILSGLKALYCFLDGKDMPDFRGFVKMFSAENAEAAKEFVSVMQESLEKIPYLSAGTPKN